MFDRAMVGTAAKRIVKVVKVFMFLLRWEVGARTMIREIVSKERARLATIIRFHAVDKFANRFIQKDHRWCQSR
jgi:hypothetical protein